MSIRRALGLVRRIPNPAQFATLGGAVAIRSATMNSSSSFPGSTSFYMFRSGCSKWRKSHWELVLRIILSGQAAIVLGLSRNYVLADDSSIAESPTDKDQGQAYVTGLRRIEDGSVISNIHTSKWRIFTDNGRDLFLKDKLNEAEKYFQLALQEAKEGFGPRDPHVASSYNNLAELYRVRKAYEKAEPLYLEAVNILEESFGTDDVRVGAALHNLGQFYLSQRKLDQAQTCYERALKIKGRVLGYGHPDYANTMYHLGTVLHLQRNDKDADALIYESIRILEEGGQGETMTCMRRMRYLSQMLLNSNRLAEAENLQRKILHIFELSKGWDSLDTVIAAEGLALTLQSLGSLIEAREHLERCLDARKRILSQDHIQVAANMLHLARIALLNSNHLRKSKVSEARAELDKAKLLVDNSIRVAKAVLYDTKKNQNSNQSSSELPNSGMDGHVALTILLQSLDFIGLLEVTENELLGLEAADASSLEAGLALRECISIFKEPATRNLLINSAENRREYLSCMKRLVNDLSESRNKSQNSSALEELKDEARRIEAELSPSTTRRNSK